MLSLAAQLPSFWSLKTRIGSIPTTEEILIRLLDRLHRHRILMVLTTRPDGSSPLVDHPHAMTLMIGRLGPGEAAQMISEVSGGRTFRQRCWSRSSSRLMAYLFFIEELTKTVLESGLLRRDGASYRMNSTLPPLAIPSTLEDSLRARLDRLSSIKDVAQVGAAIGRSFSYAIIAAVIGQDGDLLRVALERWWRRS